MGLSAAEPSCYPSVLALIKSVTNGLVKAAMRGVHV